MNKQLIDKIKSQLTSLISVKKEVKFTSVKAGELNIVSDDEELVVGSSVYIINEEGVKVELGDGEYVLDNGVKISVEGGEIKAMMDIEEELPDVEVEAEAEEKAEAEMGEDKEDKEEDMEEVVVDVEDEDEHAKQMVEMFDRLSKLEAMVEDMMSKFTDVKKEKEDLEVKLSELGEVPSEKSIEKKPVEFTSIENKSKKASSEILENIRELAKKRLNR